MKVSVIVPCFNEERLLGRCLESLQRQTWPDIEIVVVDDGSTDRSPEVAARSGVQLLHSDHAGPGVARNRGAEVSQGEILVFADADMEFPPDYIERLTAPIREGTCRGTFHRQERVANADNAWARCWALHSGLPADQRLPADQPSTSPVFRALLREEFQRVGGYDDVGYGEDITVSAKLGYPAQAAPGAVASHNNPSGPLDVFTSARWMGQGVERNLGAGDLLRLCPLVSLSKGLRGALRWRTWQYVPFRLLYDLGILVGMLRKLRTGRHSK